MSNFLHIKYNCGTFPPRWSRKLRRGRGVCRMRAGVPPVVRRRGAEHFFGGAGACYMVFNIHCGRMCFSEHAPRDPSRVLERRHGLADIVERGTGVTADRPRVSFPHAKRDYIMISENASRHGQQFVQKLFNFSEAL